MKWFQVSSLNGGIYFDCVSSGTELFPQWRQAFAFLPGVEVGDLFTTVESRRTTAKVSKRVGLQFLMQQLPQDGS